MNFDLNKNLIFIEFLNLYIQITLNFDFDYIY